MLELEYKLEEVKSRVAIPQYFKSIIQPLTAGLYDTTEIDFTQNFRCPLHEDNTASMKYYAETNTFKCFGCNQGGDIIDLDRLIMQKFSGIELNAEESVEFLYTKFLENAEE